MDKKSFFTGIVGTVSFMIILSFVVPSVDSSSNSAIPPTPAYYTIFTDNGMIFSEKYNESILVQSDTISVTGINHSSIDVLTLEINAASASELGGIKSKICSVNQFVTGINATGDLICGAIP